MIQRTKRRVNLLKAVRRSSGQALLGGTAMMVLMTMLAMGLLLVAVNLAVVGNYKQRLESIASEAAREYVNNECWMGMKRKGFSWNSARAAAEARDLVDESLAEMGMGPCINFQVHASEQDSPDVKIGTINNHVVKVMFQVSGVPLVSGGVLPSILPLYVWGNSLGSEHAMQKHQSALLSVINPDDENREPGWKYGQNKREDRKGLRVPIYNGTLGNSTPASDLIRMGDLVGDEAVAYFPLSFPHTGEVPTR